VRPADGASRFLIDLLTYLATRDGISAVARNQQSGRSASWLSVPAKAAAQRPRRRIDAHALRDA
jgi:hypothetical protein